MVRRRFSRPFPIVWVALGCGLLAAAVALPNAIQQRAIESPTHAERIRELEHQLKRREFEISQLLETIADLEAELEAKADPK